MLELNQGHAIWEEGQHWGGVGSGCTETFLGWVNKIILGIGVAKFF